MPAGLDGNPDPVLTEARQRVLTAVAEHVLATASLTERTIVGVDGRSGSGKSTFADELAGHLGGLGISTLRSTTDSFHHPRAERMRLGATSPEGYYLESHQLDTIVDDLLEPFARGAPQVRVAAFDEPSDRAIHDVAEVSVAAVLVFDGLFLQRPELRDHWNHSALLVADNRLDKAWLDFLHTDLPLDSTDRATELDERLERARWPRYRHGWTRYLESARPADRACIVIDNNVITDPEIIQS